jgi:hypothetical protein
MSNQFADVAPAEGNRVNRPSRKRRKAERIDDVRYLRWVKALERGHQAGNPPSSRLLDARIAEFGNEYPEPTGPARQPTPEEAEAAARHPEGCDLGLIDAFGNCPHLPPTPEPIWWDLELDDAIHGDYYAQPDMEAGQ